MKPTRAIPFSAAALALLLLGTAACSTLDVRREGDPTVAISHYKTFTWAPASQLEQPRDFTNRPDDMLDSTIKSQVNIMLESKGYALATNPATADLRVSYAVHSHDKLQVEPWFWDEGWPSFWVGGLSGEIVQTEEGTVDIDLVDAKTGRLAWRGVAIETVPDTGQSLKDVQHSVAEIMKPFPVSQAVG